MPPIHDEIRVFRNVWINAAQHIKIAVVQSRANFPRASANLKRVLAWLRKLRTVRGAASMLSNCVCKSRVVTMSTFIENFFASVLSRDTWTMIFMVQLRKKCFLQSSSPWTVIKFGAEGIRVKRLTPFTIHQVKFRGSTREIQSRGILADGHQSSCLPAFLINPVLPIAGLERDELVRDFPAGHSQRPGALVRAGRR